MPLERIRDSSPSVRDAARALYAASVPASERVDFELLAERDASDERSLLLVLHDGDRVQALCVATHLSYPATFIQHVVLAAEDEHAGTAAAFLNDCVARLLVPPFEGIALLAAQPGDAADERPQGPLERLWLQHGAETIIDRILIPRPDDGTLERRLLWIRPPGGDAPFPYVIAYQALSEVYGIADEETRHLMERSGMRWHG
ncbi:MAG: hypothetical protein DWG80_07665 [Chloroflexi bacterium]|nr:hypothetical protein [Chloroflexota bacterium]